MGCSLRVPRLQVLALVPQPRPVSPRAGPGKPASPGALQELPQGRPYLLGLKPNKAPPVLANTLAPRPSIGPFLSSLAQSSQCPSHLGCKKSPITWAAEWPPRVGTYEARQAAWLGHSHRIHRGLLPTTPVWSQEVPQEALAVFHPEGPLFPRPGLWPSRNRPLLWPAWHLGRLVSSPSFRPGPDQMRPGSSCSGPPAASLLWPLQAWPGGSWGWAWGLARPREELSRQHPCSGNLCSATTSAPGARGRRTLSRRPVPARPALARRQTASQ